MLRLTKDESGLGRVFEGQEFIADIRYRVLTYANSGKIDFLDGSVLPTSGTGSVRIRISPRSSVSAYLGRRLTLHMNDGMKRDFYPSSPDGDGEAFGEPY